MQQSLRARVVLLPRWALPLPRRALPLLALPPLAMGAAGRCRPRAATKTLRPPRLNGAAATGPAGAAVTGPAGAAVTGPGATAATSGVGAQSAHRAHMHALMWLPSLQNSCVDWLAAADLAPRGCGLAPFDSRQGTPHLPVGAARAATARSVTLPPAAETEARNLQVYFKDTLNAIPCHESLLWNLGGGVLMKYAGGYVEKHQDGFWRKWHMLPQRLPMQRFNGRTKYLVAPTFATAPQHVLLKKYLACRQRPSTMSFESGCVGVGQTRMPRGHTKSASGRPWAQAWPPCFWSSGSCSTLPWWNQTGSFGAVAHRPCPATCNLCAAP